MKRSEMIKRIRMALPWMNTSFAIKVLDLVEEAGMLPPPINLEKAEKIKDVHSEFELCFWEPEDD